MKKQDWSPGDIEKLKALKGQGLSDFEIAEKMGRSFGSVNTKISRLRNEGTIKTSQVPASTFPIWNDPLKSQGDAVILTDVEAPFQCSEFINRVLDLADSWGIQTLHFAGDLLHYDNLSAWGSEWTQEDDKKAEVLWDFINKLKGKNREEGIQALEESGLINDGSLSGELKAARAVFRSFDSFKEVYVALGNHDDRYLRALEQALNPSELLHQIDRHEDSRWRIAPYYYTLLETERGLFRAEHPRSATQNAAIVLAVQHHSNIVMGHSHRWAVNRDPSGKFWAIQTGHCVDETRLAYVMQRSARRDAHVLGATIIRGGVPFCPVSRIPLGLSKEDVRWNVGVLLLRRVLSSGIRSVPVLFVRGACLGAAGRRGMGCKVFPFCRERYTIVPCRS